MNASVSEVLATACAKAQAGTPDPQREKPVNSREWIKAARILISRVVPEEYREARLRSFEPEPVIDFGNEGVLLRGKTGIGKTWMATAIAIDMLDPAHNHTIARIDPPNPVSYDIALAWISTPMLMSRIRSTFRKDSKESEHDIIEEVSRYRCLVLDDLGAEKITDFSASTLYAILSTRRNHRRFTIVTTNQTLEEINAWEPRMASRLAEYTAVALPDMDRRMVR